MSERLYLLDTCILFLLAKGSKLGRHIDERYGLQSAKTRPFISIVSHGEIRVLATRNQWGSAKLSALATILENVIAVDINHPKVIEAYVEIELHSQRYPGGTRNMGKNDLWIAACAKAAGATLLTLDNDFTHLVPDMLDVEVIPIDAGR